MTFYDLQAGHSYTRMPAYKWRKICNLLSQYVPFEQEEEYLHLNIYSQSEPEHLDYQLFCILLSVVRWLLAVKEV